ncbi:S13A2 protein, partial [Eubucco bourcierii]|nr:S13A2 protein [Eubucco bourcierii]
MAGFWQMILAFRKYLIIVLVPLAFLPLPLAVPTKEAECGYVIIVMALYWCMEALPLAVTALLPVILFPMMNIMDSTTVCQEYLKDSNMLFIGGLVMAIAIESWNLHKRVALRVLLIVGVRPALLLLGFMVVTAFLSMWISNTATTAMMVPIAQAVLDQMHKSEMEFAKAGQEYANVNKAFELQETPAKTDHDKEQNEKGIFLSNLASLTLLFLSWDLGDSHVLAVEEDRKRNEHLLEEKHKKFSKGMSLCICYSASIGGIATLTGTTPNLVLQGQVNQIYPKNGNVINFASWFSFAFPTMILLLILSWVWLLILYLGFNFWKNFGCAADASTKAREELAYNTIKEENKKCGSMKFGEIAVLTLFILLVLLWFTREPGFIPGWATVLFNKDDSYVTDATVAIFISLLLFIIPGSMDYVDHDRPQTGGRPRIRAPPALLDWKTVHQKMPWNIVFLLGGGFALAKGSEESGLSTWLGNQLAPLEKIPPPAITFLLSLLVATFTECASNVATTTLFLPILASLAEAICLHPLYVMLPCTLAASFAFMLPVATPPNAIVFSYGQLRVIDMAKAGFVLNILGVLVVTLAINTWGSSLFELQTFPSWANRT